MRFEDLFLIFQNNSGIDYKKADMFIAMVNILINGDEDASTRNPFTTLVRDRVYQQYHLDDGYQINKFNQLRGRINPEKMVAFIDGLGAFQQQSIDAEIKKYIPNYRDDVVNGEKKGELSIGAGFSRLLAQFIVQRCKKPDLGIPFQYPYESPTQIIIEQLRSLKAEHFNLFILPAGTILQGNRLTLSRMNAPRFELCTGLDCSLSEKESWLNNLQKLKGPSIFIEADSSQWNDLRRGQERIIPPANQYAYVGLVTSNISIEDNEDISFAYNLIGRFPLKQLVENRNRYGIQGANVKAFFFGCHEGYPPDYTDCDGYWEPDQGTWDTELYDFKIDEFTVHPIALPMWVMKKSDLPTVFELTEIKIESIN